MCLCAALAVGAVSAQAHQDSPSAILDRAVVDLQSGRVVEAITGFDALIARVPDSGPQLWQRGIALYYAGRYEDCRMQFERHRTVNPDDVENAAWHFLCVAKLSSPEKARATLLPVGPDARVPMREVYEMLRGIRAPDRVMAAAGSDPGARFMAHLYSGLYFEALGDRARSLEHITASAAEQYRAAGGYMHDMARVHLRLLQRTQ